MLISLLTISVTFSQNQVNALDISSESTVYFGGLNLDDLKEGGNISTLDDEVITVDYYEAEDQYTIDQILTAYMLGFGAGFAFGEGDFLYCLHASMFFRLAMFTTSALYGGLGLLYEGYSGDFFTQNLFAVTGYLMMFTALTKFREVFLLYGLLGSYGFGKERDDQFNFDYDLTRFTLGALLGVSIVLSPQWSIAMYTTILTYQSLTRKYGGNESKFDNTFFALNKQNAFTISLLYYLGNKSKK